MRRVSGSTVFAVAHSVLGTALLLLGLVAMTAQKRPRSIHPRAGEAYFWVLAVSAVTGLGGGLLLHANGLTVVEALTLPTFLLGLLAYVAVKRRRWWFGRPWLFWHIVGQSASYVLVVIVFALQTVGRAFASNVPVAVATWVVPAAVGVLLAARALHRWLPTRRPGRAARTVGTHVQR